MYRTSTCANNSQLLSSSRLSDGSPHNVPMCVIYRLLICTGEGAVSAHPRCFTVLVPAMLE